MNDHLKEQAQQALKKALEPRGMKAAVSRAVGITIAAVSKWPVCPDEHVATVENVTGVSRQVLRPDLAEIFGKPPSAAE
ncbi:YdaS family helix-turn-helix protein [Terasakiella pusilla]|uniref:YdaS family helix-turn-helix protein n=1 Tax=Terasakiella pusilla TaxID=64973 RepID=UPI003AA99EC6